MPLNRLAGPGHRCPRWLHRFRADDSGTTAIEFAFVIVPFLMLLFGITAISLFYYTETVLEQALVSAARQIRTGQSRTTSSGELTVGKLRQQICDNTSGVIDCARLTIQLQSNADWTTFPAPAACIKNGALAPSSHADADAVSKGAGGRGAAVRITVCYPWELWGSLPYLGTQGNLDGGKALLIQSVRAFRSEPY